MQSAPYSTVTNLKQLLCNICEHRFKIQGEDWVIESTRQRDGRFPLRELLLQSTPEGQVIPNSASKRADIYFANRIPELRHQEIIYFAASVFWRGSSFDWSRVSDSSQLELPIGLGLEFQEFLLGKLPFPSSVVLQVEVALNPVFAGRNSGMIFPAEITPRIADAGLEPVGYFFVVFGMTFLLYFDLGRPAGLRGKATSIAESPHPIFLTDVRMSEAEASRRKMESTAKRVGRLAHSSRSKLTPVKHFQSCLGVQVCITANRE